jgi:fructosamine-3-kinase
MAAELYPPALEAALTAALGTRVLDATPLGGGMICRAARVETGDGPVFVKWHDASPPGLFGAEAHGLRLLREAGALRVPQVLAVQDEPLSFLALEFIAARPPTDPAAFARRFGEQLAALHQTMAPDGRCGLERDNFLGELVQINTPHQSWPEFYRDCRLLPQIAIARQRGLLTPSRERLVLSVAERLAALLDGLESRPALLHGDLWAGNFIAAGHEAVVIDPAVYYGEREMELAFIELFSGFPAGFVAAYRAAWPLDPGYERRRPLHQLYPLLVHLNHFGESYGPDVERACRLALDGS